MGSDRASLPDEAPPEPNLTPEEKALLEGKNGLQQFDRMIELIDAATKPGVRLRVRPSTLEDLNRRAIAGLMNAPGFFRSVPMKITDAKHQPPPPEEVSLHVDDMCDYINENWATKSPIHLSAYTLWRLNWIHPFLDGNGRTARAVSYLVLCAKLGYRLPGTKTIPERIATNKDMYYYALEDADAAWLQQRLDVRKMEELLSGHLAAQLQEIHNAAVAGVVE